MVMLVWTWTHHVCAGVGAAPTSLCPRQGLLTPMPGQRWPHGGHVLQRSAAAPPRSLGDPFLLGPMGCWGGKGVDDRRRGWSRLCEGCSHPPAEPGALLWEACSRGPRAAHVGEGSVMTSRHTHTRQAHPHPAYIRGHAGNAGVGRFQPLCSIPRRAAGSAAPWTSPGQRGEQVRAAGGWG